MSLKNYDVVYLVKNTEYNGELRYSVRSVVKNFPHRKIWFVGGLPKGIKPDYYQPVDQSEKTTHKDKYDNVAKLRKAILDNKGISTNFILFNDDFFILKPVKKLPNYINGDLETLISYVQKNAGVPHSRYIHIIEYMLRALDDDHLPQRNFELHIPMMINKKALQFIVDRYGVFRRSLYGNNFYKLEDCESIKDVKIYSNMQLPTEDQTFVSTTDASFNQGVIGQYIRELFSEPCEYEYE